MPRVPPVLGEVVDMSAGGVSVLTWDALPVHKELYLSFGPPGQRVRVRARVIWCRLRATEAGVDWSAVVDMTTFHTDLPAQIDLFFQVRDRYVSQPYPAWTAIDIDRLYPDRGLVEIDVTAYVGPR